MLKEMAVGAAVTLVAGTAHAEVSSAVRQEAAAVPGLSQPAEVIVDRWGIPHIYAKTTRDAFFLQGWNAARDRLWQIDLWRKRGLGRLSASLGPAYVAQDRAARLFLYRGDMAAEWAAYDPIGREAVEAFAAGVNAYMADVRAGKRPLPVEFALTRSQPEDWKPEDILRIRSHALVSNVTSEVARASTVCAGGLAADTLRRKLEPAHRLTVPRGLDPCRVPADVLADYVRATQPVSFDALAGKPEVVAELGQVIDERAAEGSNNWTVSAARSATGRPILAGDPHRPVGVPSLRYLAHLDAPGLSIIGAGEPALPGVSMGHNGTTAFAITINYVDQEDLYAYEVRGNAYRYKGGFEPMRTVRETIEVKGGPAREVELHFTRHGPVVWQDATRAFAIRTVWNEPGLSGYFGSSRMWRAKGWDDFQTARDRWGAPPLNLVYADTKGDIGWAVAARTPVRVGWDGLMPVPGDGRYEWKGFLEDGGLPTVRNPAAGYFATANAMNIPAEPAYPRTARQLGFEWADRSRSDRIHEVLDKLPKVTLADSMALQTDSTSPQARRAVALVQSLTSPDPQMTVALNFLKRWDGAEATGSAAAAIYEAWATKHLGPAVAAVAAPEAARTLIGSTPDPILTWLEAQPPAVRDPILLGSLKSALAELTTRLSPHTYGWTWGRLHQAHFVPAIAVLADPALATQMTVGPLQVPGSASTPRAATFRTDDFRQSSGASVRFVLDVGAWDNSMAINTPGQSADPASPHYRDLFPLWAGGSYVPLRFSRAAVEGDAEVVMTLTPAN